MSGGAEPVYEPGNIVLKNALDDAMNSITGAQPFQLSSKTKTKIMLNFKYQSLYEYFKTSGKDKDAFRMLLKNYVLSTPKTVPYFCMKLYEIIQIM